jgi:chemotaxis protein histidine kinase CheA
MRRKILVPVLIEDVKIPLEFRRLQAADLSTWTGGNTHEEVQKFFGSIATNVGQQAGGTVPGPAPEARPEAQLEAAPTPAPRLTPPPDPRPPQPEAEPVRLVPPPPAPKPKSKALLLGAAAIASIVVIAVGYTAYNERVKRQAMEQRAEQERKAAEEARRVADEAAARARLAQEAAAQEAAQRKAEQERRAADDARRAADAAAQARAARLAQEDAARTKAAQEAAARAKAAQEEAAKAAAAKQQQNTSVMRINWYDHALRFNGQLSGKPSSASLQATIYDIRTGTQIGTYDVPATVTKQGTDFVVTGTFQVPRDSVTPYPHAHTSRLVLRRLNDGSLRFIENCPQVGRQCYR